MGRSLSEVNLLAALYFHVMRIRPEEPDWPDRDRFVLSRRATLDSAASRSRCAATSRSRSWRRLTARAHASRPPDMTRLPGLDMSTGSLGSGGLGRGRSRAQAATSASTRGRSCCSATASASGAPVWEAAFVAARSRLNRLVSEIIDHNRLQQYGWQGDTYDQRLPPAEPGELVARWSAFRLQAGDRGRRPRHRGHPARARAGRP